MSSLKIDGTVSEAGYFRGSSIVMRNDSKAKNIEKLFDNLKE